VHDFALTFVPLFIAIDVLGNVPVVVSLSEGMSSVERRRMVHIATATAAAIGLAFLFFGQFILDVMGISPGSFAVAGGALLLVLSVKYMITGRWVEVIKDEMVAVVPIGTPLTVGPATVTTLLLLRTQFPLYMVLLSLILNLLIVWIVFMLSNRVIGFFGHGGLRAVSGIFNLLLAAIGVNMIIRGLEMLGILTITS
jgi:multiple antibiotic resistance protein